MERDILCVHYNEIALKGKLRGKFEKILRENIFLSTGYKVKTASGRLIMDEWGTDTIERLKMTPGVSWVGKGTVIDRNTGKLKEALSALLSKTEVGQELNLDVKRVDKNFKLTSLELKTELLKEFKIKLEPHGYKIKIEIMPDSFILNWEINRGMGGVPVGTAGKIISLFSGGIDSAVAPLEMMKRGCEVDLLHVYSLPTRDAVMKSKISELAKRISKVAPTKLFLVPFHVFGIKSMEMEPRYELVLFKRFLLKLAERLSREYGYKAICTGDALSQVASQTLDNINAISYGFDIPIFRPLLSYNKEDIISKAKEYGTYEISIEEYKDCCSIVSKNPATAATQEKVKKLENEIDIDKIINESLFKMHVERFNNGNLSN